MPLKIKSGSLDGYMGNGIYVDDAIVGTIEDISGKTSKFQQFASDLCIEVRINLQKNDWVKTFNIAGNFTRDVSTKEVTDWGGAFKVRDFFIAVGLKEELENALKEMESGAIPVGLLEATIGKELRILSYRNKKGKSSTWNQVSNPKRKKESFKSYFLNEFEKSKKKKGGPYPSNYEPEEPEENFEFGANTETEAPSLSGAIDSF